MTVHDFRIEPDVSRLRSLRAAIREQLAAAGVADSDVDRLVLVVDEIVSNAIEHGSAYRNDEDVLGIRIRVADAHVDLVFHDPSVPQQTVAEMVAMLQRCQRGEMPPLDSERGRGLFLIRDGLDEIAVDTGAGGRGLELVGRLVRAGA